MKHLSGVNEMTPAALTDREARFLDLLSDGHSIVEISKIEHIGRQAVFKYLARARGKLGAINTTNAVAIYARALQAEKGAND
jgi:DNA-binding CsgD family transcriptional regulator